MEPPIEGTENELNGEKPKCIELFVQHLTQSGYSPKMIKNYKKATSSLQRHYPGKFCQSCLTMKYRIFFSTVKGVQITKTWLSTQSSYSQIVWWKNVRLTLIFELISRPSSLPQTISFLPKSAVGTLLKQIKNKKHKSIVMLIYGCGLTVCDNIQNTFRKYVFECRSGVYIADLPPGIIDRRVDLPVTLVEALTNMWIYFNLRFGCLKDRIQGGSMRNEVSRIYQESSRQSENRTSD